MMEFVTPSVIEPGRNFVTWTAKTKIVYPS